MSESPNVRKLNVTEASSSYFVTLPKFLVKELKWRKGQKVVVDRKGDELVIK